MSYVTKSFDDKVISLLQKGRVGFMPSDTIYGLSCLALNKAAVKKLHELKKREGQKPFIVLISDLSQIEELNIDATGIEVVQGYWPGSLTVVFNAPLAPEWLTMGLDSLAVRLPSDQKLLQLINLTGPIISTSANLSGEPAVTNIQQAQSIFGEQLDFYVDGGEIAGKLPSTIVKLDAGGFEILRQGAVKIKQKEN